MLIVFCKQKNGKVFNFVSDPGIRKGVKFLYQGSFVLFKYCKTLQGVTEWWILLKHWVFSRKGASKKWEKLFVQLLFFLPFCQEKFGLLGQGGGGWWTKHFHRVFFSSSFAGNHRQKLRDADNRQNCMIMLIIVKYIFSVIGNIRSEPSNWSGIILIPQRTEKGIKNTDCRIDNGKQNIQNAEWSFENRE